MFILIIGSGRVGSAVAKLALDAGHEVSVLDSDPLSHERLDKDQTITWEDAGGRFTDDGELLHDGATNEFRLLKARRIQLCDEGGNVIGGLDDITQVEFLTPHRRAGPRE